MIKAQENMELNLIRKLKIEFKKKRVAVEDNKGVRNAKVVDLVAEKLSTTITSPPSVQHDAQPQSVPTSTPAEVSAIKE